MECEKCGCEKFISYETATVEVILDADLMVESVEDLSNFEVNSEFIRCKDCGAEINNPLY